MSSFSSCDCDRSWSCRQQQQANHQRCQPGTILVIMHKLHGCVHLLLSAPHTTVGSLHGARCAVLPKIVSMCSELHVKAQVRLVCEVNQQEKKSLDRLALILTSCKFMPPKQTATTTSGRSVFMLRSSWALTQHSMLATCWRAASISCLYVIRTPTFFTKYCSASDGKPGTVNSCVRSSGSPGAAANAGPQALLHLPCKYDTTAQSCCKTLLGSGAVRQPTESFLCSSTLCKPCKHVSRACTSCCVRELLYSSIIEACQSFRAHDRMARSLKLRHRAKASTSQMPGGTTRDIEFHVADQKVLNRYLNDHTPAHCALQCKL